MPTGGPRATTAAGEGRGDSGDRGEVLPLDPGTEEHREGDDDEDEAAAEIGLQEDERGGDKPEGEEGERLAQVEGPADALEDHRGERNAEQDLGELGRLEAKVKELDPAVRPPHRGAEQQDRRDRDDHHRVDARSGGREAASSRCGEIAIISAIPITA